MLVFAIVTIMRIGLSCGIFNVTMMDNGLEDETEGDPGDEVCPVVTLRPNVLMTSNAVFYTETATATQGLLDPDEEETYFEHNNWNLSLPTE